MRPLAGSTSSKKRACVGALLLSTRDRSPHLLLGKRTADRAFYPGVWDVLGGHCEPGETPEQTLVRELREEVGVTPTAWRSPEKFEERLPNLDETLVLHLYVVTAWAGTPHNRTPEEHTEITWVSVEEACRLSLAHPGYLELFRNLSSERS